jgi:hypothetical protein
MIKFKSVKLLNNKDKSIIPTSKNSSKCTYKPTKEEEIKSPNNKKNLN